MLFWSNIKKQNKSKIKFALCDKTKSFGTTIYQSYWFSLQVASNENIRQRNQKNIDD